MGTNKIVIGENLRITDEDMERHIKELKQRDFKELSSKMSSVISDIITDTTDDFVVWALIQSPIRVAHPDPAVSGVSTACAASDGYIYINPAFWNAVSEKASAYYKAYNKTSLIKDEIRYLLMHEFGHHIYEHLHSEKIVSALALQHDASIDVARGVALLSQEYNINAGICNELFPGAAVMRANGITDKQRYLSSLEGLGVDIQSFASELDAKPAVEWSWDDLASAALRHIPAEKRKALLQLATVHARLSSVAGAGGEALNGKSKLDGNKNGSQGKLDGDPSSDSNIVAGVHGEQINAGASETARTGAIGQISDKLSGNKSDGGSNAAEKMREIWSEIRERALTESRNCGNTPAGLKRYLEEIYEPQLSWDKLFKQGLKNTFGEKQVLATWSKASRRDSSYPGYLKFERGDMWLLADTSGSIGEKELGIMLGVALDYIKRVGGRSVKIVPWDAEVYDEIVIKRKSDVLKASELRGGGGTEIMPVLEHMIRSPQSGGVKPKDAVVICTDSEIFDSNNPRFGETIRQIRARTKNQILWVNVGREESAKFLADNKDVVVVTIDKNKLHRRSAREYVVDELLQEASKTSSHRLHG